MTNNERQIIKMAIEVKHVDVFTKLEHLVLDHLSQQDDQYYLNEHDNHTLYYIRCKIQGLRSLDKEKQKELDNLPWPDYNPTRGPEFTLYDGPELNFDYSERLPL